MRVAVPVVLTLGDGSTPERWVRGRRTPPCLVLTNKELGGAPPPESSAVPDRGHSPTPFSSS